jgi:hypothetical protein
LLFGGALLAALRVRRGLALDGSDRAVQLASEHLDSVRLAYAQHVYRQQGATVERSVVLTGGWQTSKETAYVEATRARHGTDWFIARDNLGTEGQDPQRITRLAELMRSSHRQVPSLDYLVLADDAQRGWVPSRDPPPTRQAESAPGFRKDAGSQRAGTKDRKESLNSSDLSGE